VTHLESMQHVTRVRRTVFGIPRETAGGTTGGNHPNILVKSARVRDNALRAFAAIREVEGMGGTHMASQPVQASAVTEWNDGNVRALNDSLVGEGPLLIQVADEALTVTMRTPGNDFELAAGFLFTEGMISSRDEIINLRWADDTESAVRVELKAGAIPRARETKRNFVANSSCGLCGKSSLDAVYIPGITRPNPDFRLDPQVLCSFPETLRSAQTLFGKTGGLHAAALFNPSGKLLALREDVGRHNAVDKLIGWGLMEGLIPLSECALLASGRGGFEIIQKSLMAGIPLLASVSAASSLAVQMARDFGMTLVGFLRGRRFVVYSGEERLGLGVPPERVPGFQSC
jgi:FdhD protein